jgi:hypothetical protein
MVMVISVPRQIRSRSRHGPPLPARQYTRKILSARDVASFFQGDRIRLPPRPLPRNNPGGGGQEIHHFLSTFIGVHPPLNAYFRGGVTEPQTSSLAAKSRVQKRMKTDEAG